ncbi:hypothetical protein [Nocardia amamiensis]|uniref:hypothetical protein n=1 Tax=Nocardia amamiensis TaxID=404578 RepID=UPI0018945012|nr:hypothetical protein [Nocardia amamiensis]
MKSTLVLIAALTSIFALASAPSLVFGWLLPAAFCVVMWRVLVHRNGPLRRRRFQR